MSKFIISILLSIASLFGYHDSASLGSAFTPVGANTFYLSGAGITATQTTIQVTSFKTPDGRLLTMTNFGTIGYGVLEPGTSKIEDITFSGVTQNANGSATLTGVTRGNDFIAPYAATPSLAFAHAGGASFALANTAGFYGQQFLFSNNVGSSTATISFSPNTPPQYYPSVGSQHGGTVNATTSEFASVDYVNQTVLSGAANATEAVKGIIQLATAAQQASSTNLLSTSASGVLQSKNATDTPQAKCNSLGSANGAGCTPIADLAGNVWKSVVGNLAIVNTWSASNTFSAVVSIAASVANKLTLNGVAYSFPSALSATTTANPGSPVLTGGGSGNPLQWTIPQTWTLAALWGAPSSTGNTSTTSLATILVPAGTINSVQDIEGKVNFSDNSSAQICLYSVDFGNGTATTSLYMGAIGVFGGDVNYAIEATSTTRGVVTGITVPNNEDVSSGGSRTPTAMGGSTGAWLGGTTYISFNAKSDGSATCTLNGYNARVIRY